jgi:hypothetical protein
MPPKTLQIRSSVAEFLIFTRQVGENGKFSVSRTEVRMREDRTIWLSQKLALFESYAKNTKMQDKKKKL